MNNIDLIGPHGHLPLWLLGLSLSTPALPIVRRLKIVLCHEPKEHLCRLVTFPLDRFDLPESFARLSPVAL